MFSKKGQATLEYILLLTVIAVIFMKVITHVQDIFYGWDGNKGAIELFINDQIIKKLATNQNNTDTGWKE